MAALREARPIDVPFRHEALFYADDDEYLAGTVPFVEAGLDAGEPVLVAVPQHRLELLREALPTDHPLLQLADMEAIGRNPARIIPVWVDFAGPLLSSGRSVRGIGEPVWPGRDADELVECAWHESLINLAFADAGGFELLCPYDVRGLDDDVIDEVHSTHPLVGGPSQVEASAAYRGDVRECLDTPLSPVPSSARWVHFDGVGYSALRDELRVDAEAAGLMPAAVDDAVAAINEAVVNSVRHAGGAGLLSVWTDGPTFLCEVRDEGRISDPLAGRRRPPTNQPGGRGLWLMTQLCDLVQIRRLDDGQAVRLRMNVPV